MQKHQYLVSSFNAYKDFSRSTHATCSFICLHPIDQSQIATSFVLFSSRVCLIIFSLLFNEHANLMDIESSPTIKLTIGSRSRWRKCSFSVRLACEILLFLIIFVPLLLFLFQWPRVENLIHSQIVERIRLAPMSEANKSWVNPPATTRRAYRLFNITNYMDIMTNTDNPEMTFRETKPFLYKLVIKKNNVEWLENNTKIHYSVERIFTRDGEFSEELLNQEGAFVDILRNMFRTKFSRVADSVFYILGGNNAFNYSKAIDKVEGYISPIFAAISARMQGPNREKYGFIYRYNGTNGYNFTILTGIDNTSIKGQMVDFQSEYTPFKASAGDWNIDIFDGLTFPPMGNPPNRRVINVFQADLCRPVQLRYNRTLSKFGFPKLHEYVLKLIDVDECPTMDENCPEVDRLDITKCFSAEIPEGTLFLTKPHLHGHNASSTNVAFKPNEESHESTILFEPMTGSPIRAQLRIQLNTRAQIDRLKLLDDGLTEPARTRAVPRFIPMVWVDQSITLSDEVVNRLRTVNRIFYGGQKLHRSMRITYILIGMLCFIGLIALLELYIYSRRTKDTSFVENIRDAQEKETFNVMDHSNH